MAAVLIIYTVLSTQVFYGGLVENRKESLKVYMNLFDAGVKSSQKFFDTGHDFFVFNHNLTPL